MTATGKSDKPPKTYEEPKLDPTKACVRAAAGIGRSGPTSEFEAVEVCVAGFEADALVETVGGFA